MKRCNLPGVVESTGNTTQVRTSYLSSDILWAHRLAPLVMSQKDSGRYRVDMARFDAVIPTMMPNCSARRLADIRALRVESGPRASIDDDEDNDENNDDNDDDDDDLSYFNTPPTKMRYKPRRDRLVRRFRQRRQPRHPRRRLQSKPDIDEERKDEDRFPPSTFHADYIIT